MRLRFFHCILTLSTFISLATSDVYPDNIPAQTQYPNCGTIENVFKMGTLLKKTASRGVCRELRWPGVKVDVREGCLCAFYRQPNCTGMLSSFTGPKTGDVGSALGYECRERKTRELKV